MKNEGFTRVCRVVEMTDEQWDSVVNACLRGAFLCSRAFIKTMIDQKRGKILNGDSNFGWAAVPGLA